MDDELAAIVCVDDENVVLSSLKTELDEYLQHAYEIELAEDGEDALDIFEELLDEGYQIPLVISDYIMPNMKGDELLKRIHERSPQTLTIMLTGQATTQGVTNALNEANLYRYIAKPWQPDDLRLTVTEALRRYSQERQIERQHIQLQQMNQMLEEKNRRLEHMNQELERFNASLEQQVEERTAEIEAQKRELEDKNAELDRLNASKDKLFSIIAHDLRTPLQAILGYSEHFKTLLARFDVEEEIRTTCDKAHDSTKRLYTLLENLLTWARVQRDAMPYRPRPFCLSDAIEEMSILLEAVTEQKHILIENTVSDAVQVYADEIMIKTVIRNLLSNALKFTEPGGRIIISAHSAQDMIEAAVRDTGQGIDQEGLSKLFRLDTHYTNRGTAGEKGTGLGLLLCQELVEKNGGRIWAESEPGQGTTFRFTIPCEEP